MKAKYTLLLAGLMFSSTIPVFATDSAEVIEYIENSKDTQETYKDSLEFVQKIFNKKKTYKDIGIFKKDLGKGYPDSLDIIGGDIIEADNTWGVIKDKDTVYTVEDNKVVEKKFNEFVEESYNIYHVVENDFEEPNTHKTSQQLKKEINLVEFQAGKLTKKDKATGEYIAGAKFALYVTDNDGNWIKLKTITTTDKGTVEEKKFNYSKTIETAEYDKKEWVSNFDKLSLDNQELYKEWNKEEPESNGRKTTEELRKELDSIEKKELSVDREWMLVEEYSPIGYVRTDEVWDGIVEDNKVVLPDIELTNKKVIDSVNKKQTVKYASKVSLNLKMQDKLTEEAISDGKYDLYISNCSSSEDANDFQLLAKGIIFDDGSLEETYEFESDRDEVESGDVVYTIDYDEIPYYDVDYYENFAKTRTEAKLTALNKLKNSIKKNQKQYESRDRVIKLVEVDKPNSYTKLQEVEFKVKDGKVSEVIRRDGSEKADIKFVDSKGKYLSEGILSVSTLQDSLSVQEVKTKNEITRLDGLKTDTEYLVEVTKAPKGYVELKDATCEIKLDSKGNAKTPTITNYKATYTHAIEGTEIAVKDAKGNVVDTWVSDGTEHLIENLKQYEEYTLTEVKSAQGYYRNKDVKFKVEDKDLTLKATANRIMVKATEGIAGSEFEVVNNSTNEVVDTFKSEQKPLNRTEDSQSTIDGVQVGYYLNNLVEGESYTLRQTKTKEGFVKANDIKFICEPKDKTYTIENGQVLLNVEDIKGTPIKGMGIQVKDSENNVVYEFVTGDEPAYLSNLEANRTYTITQSDVLRGYNKAEDIVITVKGDKNVETLKMTNSTSIVSLVDETNNIIQNSRVGIFDSEDNLIEEWISGKQILKLSVDQKEKLESEGALKLKASEVKLPKYIDDISSIKNSIKLAVEAEFPTFYKVTDTYNADTILQQAFELLDYNSADLTKLINTTMKKVDALKGTNNVEDVENLKADLFKMVDETVEKKDTEIDTKQKNISKATITKNKDSYNVDIEYKDSRVESYITDDDCVELSHKVSGIEKDGDYFVKEIIPSAEYLQMETVTYKVSNSSNSSVILRGEHKIKAEEEPVNWGISMKNIMILGISALTACFVYLSAKIGFKNSENTD